MITILIKDFGVGLLIILKNIRDIGSYDALRMERVAATLERS